MRRKIGKQGDFLGQEKLILSHNKTNYGTKRGDFLGQEKLTFGHNKMKYGTELVDFFGTGEVELWS
jgi:hypothetical protein